MSKVTDHLTALLADTYALAVKTHAAHWNITGPQFSSLHLLFGTHYEALFEAADELAERVRALGERAPRGIASLSKAATLDEIKDTEGVALARVLGKDRRALSKSLSKAIKVAQAAEDEATVDLLIGQVEVHDKVAWMLEATAS